jgi:hypothetical protein
MCERERDLKKKKRKKKKEKRKKKKRKKKKRELPPVNIHNTHSSISYLSPSFSFPYLSS